VIGKRNKVLYFNPDKKLRKYGSYREAWHLLLEAAKGRGAGTVDIQACCDEGDAERIDAAGCGAKDRGVFQG
jgi:hypothetical protein